MNVLLAVTLPSDTSTNAHNLWMKKFT